MARKKRKAFKKRKPARRARRKNSGRRLRKLLKLARLAKLAINPERKPKFAVVRGGKRHPIGVALYSTKTEAKKKARWLRSHFAGNIRVVNSARVLSKKKK